MRTLRFRFSLRIFLIAFTCVTMTIAVDNWRVKKTVRVQLDSIRAIESLGGTCFIQYVPPQFDWLEQIRGKPYYEYVACIRLYDSSITEDQVIAMIPHIKNLRWHKQLRRFGNSNIYLSNQTGKRLDSKVEKEFSRQIPPDRLYAPDWINDVADL